MSPSQRQTMYTMYWSCSATSEHWPSGTTIRLARSGLAVATVQQLIVTDPGIHTTDAPFAMHSNFWRAAHAHSASGEVSVNGGVPVAMALQQLRYQVGHALIRPPAPNSSRMNFSVGTGNFLLFPRGTNIRRDKVCSMRERLAGLLRYYHQEAA